MAGGEEKSTDFYGVLELKKECTKAELRKAYKKLALKWHPDRCSALGNSEHVEQAKKKFQAIQEAYSVLSDTNRRFLYDLGMHDFDDQDDENGGMVSFLNEMTSMMSSHDANDNGYTSFEELQELFNEMFESDIESLASTSFSSSSPHVVHSNTYCFNKRNFSEMSSGNPKAQATKFQKFCPGDNGTTSFEELQELFNDMFESDIESLESTSFSSVAAATPPTSSSSPYIVHSTTYCSNKRNFSEMSSGNPKAQPTKFQRFCPGVDNREERVAGNGEDRRNGQKQKTSPGQDATFNDRSTLST